jgi:hypothetical protein
MSIESVAPNAPAAAVEVYYGKPTEGGCKLVPAPLIDWKIDPEFNDVGVRVRDVNKLVLTGTVLILPSGSYEQMYAKQAELRSAFSVDEKDFVIVAGPANKTLTPGTAICSGLTPKVTSLNITPDIHVLRFDYSIELQASVAASGVSGVTSSLSNQWSFSEDADSCTLNVTHQVSAEGPDGESDKFQQALNAVKPLLGIDKLPIQLPCFTEPNASGGWGFTHPSNPAGGPVFEVSVQREEVADVANGTYQVTEVFTIVSGVPFYFSSRTETFDEDSDGVANVTVQGTIQGLGRTLVQGEDAGGVGYLRASSGFLNVIKPQIPWDASGVYVRFKPEGSSSGLNIFNPTAISISQNKCRGTVGFSYTYTDSPAANLPSGIASKSLNVSTTEALRLKASHVIPFRRLGNIIQDIKTTTEGTISITCQAQARNTNNPIDDTNRAIEYVQDELNRLKNQHVNPANFITTRISNLTQSHSEIDLTSSATLEVTFTSDLADVPDIGSDISLRMI